MDGFFIRGIKVCSGRHLPDTIGVFFKDGQFVGTMNTVTKEYSIIGDVEPDSLFGSDVFLQQVKLMMADA